MNSLRNYLKIREAASLLGVSPNTLRAWASAGKVKMHRNPANGYRLFRRIDLDRFLQRAATPIAPLRKKRPR